MDDNHSISDLDIAIVGMGLHVPGARTPEQFWQNIRNGVESVQSVTDTELLASGVSPSDFNDARYVRKGAFMDGVADFDPEFFGLGPKEAAIMDPQHRHFLEVCWEALDRAGHPPSKFDGAIGVFGGCGMGKYMIQNLLSNKELVDSIGYFLLRHTGNDKDFLTTRVAYTLSLNGPAIGIQTACSTSLVAVHMAVQSLLSGECDMALAGGVTIEIPQKVGYLFVENEILSPDGHCRAFDHRAEGTIFGSGAGVVALRRLKDAIEDDDQIHAVIKGSAVNNDGSRKVSYLAPSVDGQAAAISEALAVADTPAETIGYVEAHGTGTPMGDPIEISALTQAFQDSTQKTGFCGIGSVKTNIGHLDTAAGVVSLIKTVLALENREFPPSLNWEAPNPKIDFASSPFYVSHLLRNWPDKDIPRRAGVNSLGVGGTNAYVVLEEAPKSLPRSTRPNDKPVLLQLSARNQGALDGYSRRLSEYLRLDTSIQVHDVAFSLRNRKHDFQQRRVLACASRDEAINLLENGDPFRVFSHVAGSENAAPVFLLPGGGAQYLGMGAGLHKKYEVFQRELDRCIQIVEDKHELDLRPFLFAENPGDKNLIKEFERPSIQLPAILAIEYALAKLWMSRGVEPLALLGHSMGENTAACLAGVFTLEAALGLVCLRGKLFETIPDGGMLSVLLSADDTRTLLTGELVLAVENGPELSVVSGPSDEIAAFTKLLEAREIEATRIPINIAAHSPMLTPILEKFHAYLRSISLASPEIPFISNRTGTWITTEQATSPEYWVDHLRGTVHFSSGLNTLLENYPNSLLIETGPGSTLTSLARLQPAFGSGANVITSLRHRDQDVSDELFFMTALGRLWASGRSATALGIENTGQRVMLPTYAFQRSRYWIEPGKPELNSPNTLLKRDDDIQNWYYEPVWEPEKLRENTDQGCLSWLVFVDEVGLGEALVLHLRQAGHSVIAVRNGIHNLKRGIDNYVIDSDRGAEGYLDLASGMAEDGIVIDRILHLWMLTGEESSRTALNRVAHNIERSFYSLFHLFRALGERDALSGVHVIAISNGACQVFNEPVPNPEKATSDGPCMVASQEYPGLSCTSIDIDFAEQSSKGIRFFKHKGPSIRHFEQHIIEEFSGKAVTSKIAYRKGVRYELTYRRSANKPASSGAEADIKGIVSGGTYLITGGLGGLGLVVAESMALTPGIHLLLVSRSGLIPREEWDNWMIDADPSDRSYQTIMHIRRLESLGASVEVAAVDITDHEELAKFVEDSESRFGPVKGVVHAAGVIHDDLIALKSTENVETVFAPKIYGAMVLDMVFRDRNLDFMILFSSSSTVIAPPGQVDYVAANAYLNAFAASRAQRKKERVIALCWGVWNEVGIAAEATDNFIKSSIPTLHPLLSRRQEFPGEIVFDLVPLSTATHWVLNEHRLADGRALIPGTAYIELANYALSEISLDGVHEILNLEFLSPLAVDDQAASTVRMKISKEDDDKKRFLLQSLVKGTDGKFGWLTHSRAEIYTGTRAQPANVQIAEILARCEVDHRKSKEGGLVTAQASHVSFGPRWDVLNEQAYGEAEAYAFLTLPEMFLSDLESYAVHPALFDIATGHAMQLIEGYDQEDSSLWVPVSYEKIRIFAPLTQAIFSWVRSRGTNQIDDPSASFDIKLTDLDGRLLVDIENFTVQKAPPGDLLASIKRIDPDILEPVQIRAVSRSASSSGTPVENQLRHAVSQGIRPGEGMQIFRHLTQEFTKNRVIVSSLDLDELRNQSIQLDAGGNEEGTIFERPQLDSEYTAPENAVQAQLAEIWQGLLGIETIGINDSFFDLGGHSLIAVRLFAKIKNIWDINLPVSTLLEFPTIEELSNRLPTQTDDEQITTGASTSDSEVAKPPGWTTIVPMKKVGARPPFFCVAGKGGNPMNLRHLAKHLDPDQPFYGIQHRGVDGNLAVHETVEEMAAECIRDVRDIQASGPYMIGGFSGGGLVAFEMAKQLDADGEQVSLLALFDAPSPTRRYRNKRERMALHRLKFRQQGPKYLIEKLGGRISRLALNGARNELPEEDRLENELSPHVAVGQAWERMERRYAQSPWDGSAVLFRPYVASLDDVDVFLNEDKFNGWSEFFLKGIQVIELPGGHSTMFEEPHVRILARRLTKVFGLVDSDLV